jgi:Mn-dependent DtxR family transcriptional regulator
MAAKPTIRCAHCRGKGAVPLSGVYMETWAALRRQKERVSGADLARLMGVPETAMNNRLVALERHGLAEGEAYGRKRLWRAM